MWLVYAYVYIFELRTLSLLLLLLHRCLSRDKRRLYRVW